MLRLIRAGLTGDLYMGGGRIHRALRFPVTFESAGLPAFFLFTKLLANVTHQPLPDAAPVFVLLADASAYKFLELQTTTVGMLSRAVGSRAGYQIKRQVPPNLPPTAILLSWALESGCPPRVRGYLIPVRSWVCNGSLLAEILSDGEHCLRGAHSATER